MSEFSDLCRAAGGRSVGLSAEWCVDAFDFGSVGDGFHVFAFDDEDDTFSVIEFNEDAFALNDADDYTEAMEKATRFSAPCQSARATVFLALERVKIGGAV